MSRLSKYLLLSAFTTLLIGGSYYFYASNQAPKKALEAQQTIINVDSLRFTFKISIMAQKGLGAYRQAIAEQDKQLINEAIDFYSVALGFADTALIQNADFVDSTKPILLNIIKEIEDKQLNQSTETLNYLTNTTELISTNAAQQEREDWIEIQQGYIEFNTHEYQVTQLFIAFSLASFFFLIATIWFISRQSQLIKKNKKQSIKLHQMAYYDSLTQIPNRKQIEQLLKRQIDHARKEQSSFFICLIDIDDFKNINDLLGHMAGDELLKQTVEILVSKLSIGDKIGRLGGDEFLMIFENKTSYTQLTFTLQKIQDAFNNPIKIANSEFKVTLSMGVSSFPEENLKNHDNASVEHLIKSADIAMYESKNKGKNQYHFYDASLEAYIQLEHQMSIEIKQAIENNEFELYYQPQIDSKTQKIVAAEALVRWNHPQKGFLTPIDFIDFIEKGIHTADFGEWVIKNAIEQQQAWFKKGLEIELSINLAVKHVLSKNFYEKITTLITQTHADLQSLNFEITEYELIQSSHNAIEDIKRLNRAGFKFHLDDFGTGYSSLSYLNELPIEAIKIDKSFIDYIEPEHPKQNLVEAIIHIGDTLNKQVIAEGVETEYQVKFLSMAGCELLQGYYFSKPVTAQQFEQNYQKDI